jgi:cyclic-di-AMP phosphodiesterase PgpH
MKQNITSKLTLNLNRLKKKSAGQKLLILVLVVAYFAHFFLITTTTPFSSIVTKLKLADYSVGESAPGDIIVDKDITYVDEEATRLREEATIQLVPPVFVINDEITKRSLQSYNDFAAILTDAAAKSNSTEKIFLAVQAALPGTFTQEQIELFLKSKNILSNLNEARLMLEQYLHRGVVNIEDREKELISDTIDIRRFANGDTSVQTLPAGSIIEIADLYTLALSEMEAKSVSAENAVAIAEVISAICEENAFFDAERTALNQTKAGEAVVPVVRKLVKGERIVKSGAVISEQDMLKITALGEYSTTVSLNSFIGTGFFLLIVYLLASVLFLPPFAQKKPERKQIYLILGIATGYLILAVIFVRIPTIPSFLPLSLLLPTALASMLIAILVSHRSAISFSLLIALLLLPVTKMEVYATLLAFLSGFSGALIVSGAKKRIDLIRASMVLSFLNGGIMMVLGILRNYDFSLLLVSMGWAMLNGIICAILNLGILPFLEHLLNTATPFRLIELSDLNSPVLKRMLSLAPGTYQHSVAVANLAESACREIGANPFLARVGAYYHDIGKIDQAEYFVENQTVENKHDDLKPSLSVSVIKSHVKIGYEKGKELGLPQEILDIITQHHGSGLISYFYVQAIKAKEDKSITPEDYSYSGTPPISKEAAVIMLADGVEAASRTLKKPNVAKLEKLVWEMIMDKFTSGQMNNCDITFRDLETIKRAFVHILAGHFHSRIEYPEVVRSK